MKEKETQYRREVLLKDPRFARYQPDFLAAVKKTHYTLTKGKGPGEDFGGGGPPVGGGGTFTHQKQRPAGGFIFASGRRTNRI